jgi:VWFA-related protein
MTARPRRVLLALACAVGLAGVLHGDGPGPQSAGQQATPPAAAPPPAAQPSQQGAPAGSPPAQELQTFRTRVELVSVDVNVVDREGRPQSGLGADDFQVTVDGKPRRVQTAEFVDLQKAGEPAPATAPGDQPLNITWSSNEGAAASGRLYALVVDQANIQPGGMRAASEAAKRFVMRLAPTDRVALFTIPSGPSVDFTADHSRVLIPLSTVSPSGERLQGRQYNVSVSEALSLQNTQIDVCQTAARMNEEPLNGILTRNRCFSDDLNLRSACCEQVVSEAMRIGGAIQFASRQSLMALETVLDRLSIISGPKTVVLLSQRLVTGGAGRLELSTELKRLGRVAAAAHITFYVLHLSRSFVDDRSAEFGGVSDTPFADESVSREGLELLAGYARGTVVRVVAGADFAFERIQRETSAYYLLAFEPTPEERDGKPHQIRVRVQRRGVEVRARSEFVISPTSTADPKTRLVELLRTPGARTLLPMRVATRVVPGNKSERVQVVVAADIGREATAQNVSLAYFVSDETGRIVTAGGEKRMLEPSEGVFGDLSLRYTSVIELPPGRYRLKLAALDESGSEGSVEHPLDVRLTDAGPLVLGDLVLASAAASALAAGIAVDDTVAGARARAYVQMRPKQDITGRLEVTAEVADTPAGRPLVSTGLTVGPTREGLIVADGPIDLRLLPPGNYYARASVSLDGKRLASRSTPFRLVSPVSGTADTAPAAAVPRSPGATLAIGADRLLLRSFDRRDVLRPDVVSYFVDRLAAVATGAPEPVGEARQAARRANFSELGERLNAVDAQSLDAVFLRGIERYASGELEAAAKNFSTAIEMNPEFLPAIFYLGACYAAGGRDREAVGAWQAALITESDARIVYEVLVDALLRLNDIQKAGEVLQEARGRWDDEDMLVPRTAAVAAAGRDAKKALGLLQPYLVTHPDNTEALFLAMRLIYQASADAKPLVGRREDADLMAKYAKLYGTANGTERAIVDRWLTFVRTRQ